MVTVSRAQIASYFLADLHAPDNQVTNTAVQVWETRESGSQIIGNNPWNIHYQTALDYGIQPSGKWWSSSDQAYIASFATIQDGVAASAKIINQPVGDHNGYGAAAFALKTGSGTGFLNAIAASNWSSSHYGAQVNTATHTITGGVNGLITDYNKIVGSGGSGGSVSTGSTGGGASAGSTGVLPPQTLASFLGHDGTLTLADLPNIVALILASPAGSAYEKANGTDFHTYLVDFVGHKYSDIPLNLGDTAQNLDKTGPSSSGSGYPNITIPGADILAYIADPAHWLYILALGIGISMTGYGIVVLVRAYGAPEAPAPTVP